MKQVTMPNAVGLNAEIGGAGNPFSTSDLLTAESLSNARIIPPNNNIPDLENSESFPSAEARNKIRESVNVSRADTIDEVIEKEINQNRLKYNGIPGDPKNVLKELIDRGQYKEDFALYGHTWTLRALDQSDVLLALDEIKDSVMTFTGRFTYMAVAYTVYALDAIDVVSVYEWFPSIKKSDYGNNDVDYIIAVRRALKKYFEALPPKVIDDLYEKYTEVDKKRNEALDQLKNS